MKMKLKILVFFICINAFSQIKEKEVIVSEGVSNNITSAETGMYGGTKSIKAQNYFDKAFNFSNKKDFKNAEIFYKKSIKEDTNFIEAYDNLGRLYRSNGYLDKAEKMYLKSIKLYPNGAMAHQNVAVVYGIQKRYNEAIEQYEELIRLDSSSAEGYFGLANSNMMLKNYKTALINAKKTILIYENEKSPYLNEGYFLLGLIYYYSNDIENAKEYIIKAKNEGANIDPKLEEELGIKPNKNEKFKPSEEQILKAIVWLQNTPLDKDKKTRTDLYGFLMKWMTDCDITIEITEEIVPYTDSIDCIMIFMTGWVQQVLTTKNEDKLVSNLYATERVLEFYAKNKNIIGENSKIEKFKKLKEKNKLKKFIKSNIK